MSNSTELRPTMPCGFAAATGAQLTFTEVKSRPGDAIPVDKLSEDQKRKLAIDCWNHGFWEDLFIGDRHISKPEAIDAVNEGSELGKNLVQITMTGYNHIYKSFLLHDEEKYPLVKKISDSPEPSSELTIVSESMISRPVGVAAWTDLLPRRPQERHLYSPPAFTIIYNHLSVTVYIYKLDISYNATYFRDIPAKSKPVSTTPDFTEQWWAAHASKDPDSSILGHYVAYPGCTTWNIASFPTDSFLPSAWNSPQKWNVRITNNLKTYVCIWQVMPNGSLNFVSTINSGFSTSCGLCYLGTSLVATQGDIVISKFFIDSTECTTWSLDINTPPGGEEIYATGDNNYIFYQVYTPRDDMVTPVDKYFSQEIPISSEVAYLYASLFDSCNAYFAAPKDVTVTIVSQDALSSAKTNYDSNTSTDSLYIQMTTNGKSLQKLCVKDPAAGVWTIKIQAKTNTPVYFQFQTVPTADPCGTMQATLSSSSVLGSKWEDISYGGYANIASNTDNYQMLGVEKGTLAVPPIVAGGMACLVSAGSKEMSGYLIKDVQNDQGVVKKATDTIKNAAAPTPPNLHNILLVDANGFDNDTKFVFECRNERVYPKVKSGAFRNNYSDLVGENNAIKEKFVSKLEDSNLKFVSVAGHGNNNHVYGHREESGPQMPILSTIDHDVIKRLVTGKIFHFLACKTASELGQTLVSNGAIAFIGYKETFKCSSSRWTLKPDCSIDENLIKGETVEQAVAHAKEAYQTLIKNHSNPESLTSPSVVGALEHNHDALMFIGKGCAVLLQPSNQDEQQKSTSQDEQQKGASQDEQRKSTSQDEQQKSTSQDEQQKSISQDERQKSTSQDEQQKGASQDEQRKSTSQDEQQKSTSQDERQKSTSQDKQQKSTSQDKQQKSTSQDELCSKGNVKAGMDGAV